MKPKNIIEQLVGKITGWDQSDTLDFIIYGSEKFGDCNVSFSQGVVEKLSEDGTGVIERYEIKAELVKIN